MITNVNEHPAKFIAFGVLYFLALGLTVARWRYKIRSLRFLDPPPAPRWMWLTLPAWSAVMVAGGFLFIDARAGGIFVAGIAATALFSYGMFRLGKHLEVS
jgi:hypothetical protein